MASTRTNSRAQQRQIDLSTAVSQERLLSTHVRHVLAMVDLVADQMPFDDALDIYVRILRLTPEQARNVGSRAFAALGSRSGLPEVDQYGADLDLDDDTGHDEEGGGGRPDAVFARLRRRIRGRVHEDLRNRINLAAARAEDSILQTHVENSLIFVRAIGDEMPPSDSVEKYLETMMLEEGKADVIYNRALRVIADDVLPPLPPARKERVSSPVEVGIPPETGT